MEIWKDINGYEGLYKVSNNARVYSVKNQKILKKVIKSTGYHQVSLCKDGVVKAKIVHRLLMEAFVPNIENKPFINHINGIRNDNRIENLEWCNQSHNIKHSYLIGKSVLTEEKKKKMIESISIILLDPDTGVYYTSVMDAARTFGVNNDTLIRRIRLKYKTNLIIV